MPETLLFNTVSPSPGWVRVTETDLNAFARSSNQRAAILLTMPTSSVIGAGGCRRQPLHHRQLPALPPHDVVEVAATRR